MKLPPKFLWTTEAGWPDIWVARWTDPTSETQKVWMTSEDIKKINPLECMAVGFLIERTEIAIKLCTTVAANGHSGQMITIPIKSINQLDRLAVVGKKGTETSRKRNS